MAFSPLGGPSAYGLRRGIGTGPLGGRTISGIGARATSSLFNFKPITNTISGAFDWLGKNPVAAAAIGGAASAGLGYLASREQIRAAKKARAEERAYRSTFGGASTVAPDEYGRKLDIADPGQGIAAPVGEVAPQGAVGQVGQQPSMATALQLRAARGEGRR